MEGGGLEAACAEIVAVGAELEHGCPRVLVDARLSRAVEIALPALTAHVEAACRARAGLLRTARLEVADVRQEVLGRLLMRPPCNPGGNTPVAVVLGWARAVAQNVLIDALKRGKRWGPLPGPEGDEHTPTRPVTPVPLPDEIADSRRRIEHMRVVARAALEQRPQLLRTFEVLVEDWDIPGIELAERVGLIGPRPADPVPPEYRESARRAEANAFQHRRRMLDALAVPLGAPPRKPEKKR